METIQKIQNDVKQALSLQRYEHSLGAMKQAEELARQYGESAEKARLTGLVHDIAKEMTKEQMQEYMERNQIIADEIEILNPGLLHAKIGAYIAKKQYQFSDDMVQAIAYHTTGHVQMSLLDKIIYIADKVEETRTYEDAQYAKELAEKNIDECMLYILNVSIKKNIDKGKFIHPDSIFARNEILKNTSLKI